MSKRLIAVLLVLGSLASAQELQPTQLPVTAKIRWVKQGKQVIKYSIQFTNDSDETIYIPMDYPSECTGIGWEENVFPANGEALQRKHPIHCPSRRGKLSVWIGVPERSFELRPRSSIGFLRMIQLEQFDARPGPYRLTVRILGWTPAQLEALRLPGKLDTLRGRPLIGKLEAVPFSVEPK